jgi:xylitol oxidase
MEVDSRLSRTADRAGRNWAGNYHYSAASIIEAQTIDDVRAVVRKPGALRALGTRHSFNGLPDSSGSLVSVLNLPADPVLDERSRTVSVGAGARFGDLAAWLEERGWALNNLGSLPHISIAGAISTGTHGSGDRNGILSTAVTAMQFVDYRGELTWIDRTDPRFPGLVVGLGLFGVVVRLSLNVRPSFRVRQDVFGGVSWAAFLAEPQAVTGAAYSVSVFTRWAAADLDQVWLKSELRSDDQGVAAELLDGRRLIGEDAGRSAAVGDNATRRGGIPGPWNRRLPHFRLDAVPSVGMELQSEYFVDRADAEPALRAIRDISGVFQHVLVISELRTAASDHLWLSGAFERDTLAIHFTWKLDLDGVLAVLPVIESALKPFGARPHWGKLHLFTAADLHRVYPQLDSAARLFAELDPEGRFANDHLRELGLIQN